MNADSESAIHHVLVRIRMDESGTFNKDFKKVLEDKEKLKRLIETPSQVYKKRRLPGPPSAQNVNFRLAPIFSLQETASCNRFSDANTWTVTAKSDKLQKFPIRASTRETWLQLLSKLEVNTVSQTNSPVPSPIPTPSIRSDNSSYPTSSSCTPLPVFKRRNPTATFLIRRPTIERPIPLTVEEELFEVLVKSFELKAFRFNRTTESYNFYVTHFPLLLTRKINTDRCQTPSRMSRTPDSPMSAIISRKQELNERIVELDYMMKAMENETDTDCKFITELHSAVFDPTAWSWNVVDVSGLRRRYTLEAALKEI